MTTAIEHAVETAEQQSRRVTLRKRVLRQLGVRVTDLSPVGRQRLDAYIDLRARLLDAQRDPAGGRPSEYAALAEATSRALSELERHLGGAV